MTFIDGFSGFIILVALFMMAFGRNILLAVIGVVFIVMIAGLGQRQADKDQYRVFILERFKAGDAIECGLLRESQTLVDSNNGWKLYGKDRFIKADQIINEIDWCNVPGKEPVHPIDWNNWFFYGAIIVGGMVLRFLLRNVRKSLHDDMDKEIAKEEVSQSSKNPQ